MVNITSIVEASMTGLPTLKEMFERLPISDALEGLGIMVVLGINAETINSIKEIVENKTP